MGNLRIAPAVLSILVALLLLATIGVQAKATKTSFTGTETFNPVGPPAREWIAGGIQHVRGIPISGTMLGTIDGALFSWSNSVVFGFNLDLATGDGNGFGTCYFVVTWGADSGTFERCRFTARFAGPVFSVDFVGHGSGNFEGMKIKGTGIGALTGPGAGWLIHEGIVLDPHG